MILLAAVLLPSLASAAIRPLDVPQAKTAPSLAIPEVLPESLPEAPALPRQLASPEISEASLAEPVLPEPTPPGALGMMRPPDFPSPATPVSLETLKGLAMSFFAGPLPSSREEAVPLRAAGDETALLKGLHQQVRDGKPPPLRAEARAYRYLLIPGFSWDTVPRYLQPNLKRLRALGLDAEFVATHPLGTHRSNAAKIRAAILASDKPVVIIGHSKGGVDALETLRIFPELEDKVAHLVALQSPIYGSAVADWFLARPAVYLAAMAHLRLTNPTRLFAVNPFRRLETVRELSKERRGKGPASLPTKTRLYSIASRVSADTAIKLLLWITAGTVKTMVGRDNDGIIVPEEAVIEGSRYALLEHVGHIDTIADPSSWRHRILGVRGHDTTFAADLTEAIVRWIFP